MLDLGHECVHGSLENKYARDTGVKSENTLICHFTLQFLLLQLTQGLKNTKWKIPERKDS